jgi:hypothetical protein
VLLKKAEKMEAIQSWIQCQGECRYPGQDKMFEDITPQDDNKHIVVFNVYPKVFNMAAHSE